MANSLFNKIIYDLYDWIIARTHQPETFTKIATMIGEYSQAFEEEATKYQLPCFNMDDDFEKQLALAGNWLIEN